MIGDHNYYVYMLASKLGGTLYVGVTNDLTRRVSEHRLGEASKFTKKYNVFTLVWYEPHTDINVAINREKRLKNWNRKWKIALIEERNPNWLDLFPSITGLANTRSPVKPGDDRNCWLYSHQP